MAKEVLTKLSNDDLKHVCSGQIYFATGEKGPRWYVPTPPSNKYDYSGWFSTKKGAVNYARVNGLWLDITPCESYKQASAAAEASGALYCCVKNVPYYMNAQKWNEQLMELNKHGKVSPFSY